MLVQPSRRFERVPIVFRSRPSRPKGITGRRRTQLYFATVGCLFPESLVIFAMLGVFDRGINDSATRRRRLKVIQEVCFEKLNYIVRGDASAGLEPE
jgi:hypothetical protein